MDIGFHIIDDGIVILRSKGIYRQAKVYERKGEIYAGYGERFIKLGNAPNTTDPNVSWDEIDADGVTAAPGKRPRLETSA